MGGDGAAKGVDGPQVAQHEVPLPEKDHEKFESDKFLTEEERSFLRESHKSEGRRGKAGNQKTRAESSIRGRFTRGQKTKRQLSIKSILGWLGTSCGRTWKTRRLWRAGLH